MLTIERARAMLPILLVCGAPAVASAQTTQSTPYLQDAGITGFGSTITINRLPIGVSGGGFVYKDVTITLTTADNAGTLKSTATVTQATSPLLSNTSNIVAGDYVLSNNGNNQILVSGPAPIGKGGEAKWTIVQASEDEACAAPSDFYTGSLKENPLYSRLQAAGITSNEYSYGVIDGTNCGSPFAAGALIGVSQVGSELQIATFTNNGQDQSIPVTSEIFSLVQ